VLLGTVAGTALSYLLWIFAGQFWMLIVARGLGGIMSGNVAVGSAAMADVTPPEKRSRGLALVGVAFGLGFILGPALGGTFAGWNLLDKLPNGAAFGINPFSGCAVVAFGLCVVNYFWVLLRFPETLPPEKRADAVKAEDATATASGRLVAIFRVDLPAIRRTNLVNLYYTIAFSGMEFTLTFLAAERFAYTPGDMVKIFVFMGAVLVITQGWLGRRWVPKVGERKAALTGIACGMGGFLVLAFAGKAGWFYAGLAVFAAGVGLTSVCLPALVSRYSDATTQGRYMGSTRAAQALGRAIGPLFAAVIYFSAGARVSYTAGAVALVIPLWLATKLPEPQKAPQEAKAG
jgi:MFS family permease